MAAYVDLIIDQGTSFNSVINLTDDITNSNINVAGYIVTAQIRRSYYSANATANLTCTITNANTGEFTLSLTAGQTANIKAGRYLFDVKTSYLSTVQRLIEGTVTVTPGITR